MNIELTLIKLLLQYNTFLKYNTVIDKPYLKDTCKEIYYIYTVLEELCNNTKTNISLDELSAYFFAKFPDSKGSAAYEALFEQLYAIDITEVVGENILAAMQKRKLALELSEASFSYTQGRATIEQVKALAEALEAPAEDVTKTPSEDLDLEAIINSSSMEPGIRWRLQFLNKSLGSLRPGDFGMLIKRPESGGTLFCADVEMYAVDQVTRPIIHFNNEEDNKKVILRMYMSYFGATKDQILSNWQQYNAIFRERVAPKYKFYGLEHCTKRAIENIIDEHNPALVVYDQMSKIKGFENDRLDLKLGDTYQWARELTKKGHAAIAIHQADGTAEGQKWLDMGHVANAKTSIQAECDFILGMGMTHNPNEESIRFINISKNKLLGDPDSDGTMRHGRSEVLIQPHIMRMKDILSYE